MSSGGKKSRTLPTYDLWLPITVFTDHQAILWLMNKPNPAGKFCRWIIRINEYDCSFKHVKGVDNQVADLLSRPIPVLRIAHDSSIPPNLKNVGELYHSLRGAHLSRGEGDEHNSLNANRLFI